MTKRCIVYTRPDGGVSVVVPSPDFVAGFKTTAMAMAAIRAKDVPTDAIDVVECDTAAIPPDRTFRDAWERDTSPSPEPIRCNMDKSRGIHMGRIRLARDDRLKSLDGPWMRAAGQGDTTEADRIEAQRRTLRDIPQTFDLSGAATPDALKALWPAELS